MGHGWPPTSLHIPPFRACFTEDGYLPYHCPNSAKKRRGEDCSGSHTTRHTNVTGIAAFSASSSSSPPQQPFKSGPNLAGPDVSTAVFRFIIVQMSSLTTYIPLYKGTLNWGLLFSLDLHVSPLTISIARFNLMMDSCVPKWRDVIRPNSLFLLGAAAAIPGPGDSIAQAAWARDGPDRALQLCLASTTALSRLGGPPHLTSHSVGYS